VDRCLPTVPPAPAVSPSTSPAAPATKEEAEMPAVPLRSLVGTAALWLHVIRRQVTTDARHRTLAVPFALEKLSRGSRGSERARPSA
jgi:hypothetical protein